MKKAFEKVNCNACGADDYETISSQGQFDLPAHVVLCKRCGLSYLNPRWDKASYIHFYTHEYDKYYRPDIKQVSIDTAAKNAIFERLSQNGFLKEPPVQILDIGSGAGANLLYFKSKYPASSYSAIEPSEQAASILKNNDINVISRDVDADWHKAYPQQFDLIIMRHVLEHFSDPTAALKKVAATLREDGLLYLAVPNNMRPTTPLLSNWFRVVHTYYFNQASLNNVLINSGLQALSFSEDDQYMKGELVAFVKKQNKKSSPLFEKAVFEKQKQVFQERLEAESKLLPTFKRQWKRMTRKTRSLIAGK